MRRRVFPKQQSNLTPAAENIDLAENVKNFHAFPLVSCSDCRYIGSRFRSYLLLKWSDSMQKRSFIYLSILFYAVFFGSIGVGSSCFSGDGAMFTGSVSAASTFSQSSGDNNQPTDHNRIGNVSCVSLPSACLSSETNGSRQLPSAQGRLTLLVRLHGFSNNALRGSFFRIDDIRSHCGLVRPHLYFCRLLI